MPLERQFSACAVLAADTIQVFSRQSQWSKAAIFRTSQPEGLPLNINRCASAIRGLYDGEIANAESNLGD
jgi:hypothetical protein